MLSHHAYLVPHSYETVHDELRTAIGERERVEIIESALSIERAREIIDTHQKKANTGERAFIVAFDTATREAQNALLKILEEPTPSTRFFVVTPNAHLLLSTLRSRLADIPAGYLRAENVSDIQKNERDRAMAFLTANAEERLVMIKTLADTKDRQGTARFIGYVAKAFENERSVGGNGLSEWAYHLKTLMQFTSYAEDPASSPKMLLEHIALTIPVITKGNS